MRISTLPNQRVLRSMEWFKNGAKVLDEQRVIVGFMLKSMGLT